MQMQSVLKKKYRFDIGYATILCDGSYRGSGWQLCETVTYNNFVVGPSPDFYVAADPEADPLPDAQWHTADAACGDGNFVTLGTNGDFVCKSCSGDGSTTGQEFFLAEFTKERGVGEGAVYTMDDAV